jgi:ABC-type transport system involved in cytochrome bd biosynthesis fused ATPase/permease subunit
MTNVNLQYQSMKKPAVSGVNIKVAPGSRVAICGKGGSGKGTILAGLARVLLPTGQPLGSIKVGGVDTKQIGRKRKCRINCRLLSKGGDAHSLPIHLFWKHTIEPRPFQCSY